MTADTARSAFEQAVGTVPVQPSRQAVVREPAKRRLDAIAGESHAGQRRTRAGAERASIPRAIEARQ